MYLSEITQKGIPTVRLTDKVSKALEVVTQEQLTHIVIVEDKELKGLLTEECLWMLDAKDEIQTATTHFQNFQLFNEDQLLDSFGVFQAHDCNIIPILNNKEIYQGVVLMEEVVNAFAKYPFVKEKGAILAIEVSFQNYSMQEISKIVEGNNAKLYGAMITSMSNEMIELTLKITTEHLSSVGETFERYGYTVKQKYYEDKKDQLLEERYKQFQKYMEL